MELRDRIKFISSQGYVRSHRKSNTGIGKTLEDLLGIEENNRAEADIDGIEIKSGRRGSSSLLTLFTRGMDCLSSKVEFPTKLFKKLHSKKEDNNEELFLFEEEEFRPVKYVSESMEITLCSNRVTEYNGYKLSLSVDRINGRIVINSDGLSDYVFGYSFRVIERECNDKLKCLLYVTADSQMTEEGECFWYNNAVLYTGIDYNRFIDFIERGIIVLDIRIGMREDGSIHDHGIAFRISPLDLGLLYDNSEVIVNNSGNDLSLFE